MAFWFGKRREQQFEQDVDRELRSHFDLEREEQEQAGLSSKDAAFAARKRLGNMTQVKENVRAVSHYAWLDTSAQDLAYALRFFSRSPGFTAVVLLTLTLGIGANTAVFSILNSVVLQPLPFRDSNRLVAIWERQMHEKGTSKLFDLYSDFENWKENAHEMEGVTAVSWAGQASPSKILTGHGPARSIFTLPVSANFFDFLGVRPLHGQAFTAADAGGACKVVLTYQFWEKAFGGLDSAIGSPIRLDGQTCTIAAVMPRGFGFLPPGAPVTMWTILPRPVKPDDFAVAVFGRLRPGVSRASAQAEILALHEQLHKHDRWGARMRPVLYDLHEEFTWLTGRNLQLSLYVLFAAVCFVLLICCVNVANLLLGRAVTREREMAIRASLGSGRMRLMRQLLTECLLFSVLASGFGILLAKVILRYFETQHPVELPPGVTVQLSAPVLGFTIALSILTCLLCGLAPAWRGSRADVQSLLTAMGTRSASQGSGQRRFGKQLIVAEVALTAVLLSGAGLLVQTVYRFATAPLGFEPRGLVTTTIALPPNQQSTPERRIQFFQSLQNSLVSVPGILSVALTNSRPIDGGGVLNVIAVEGHPQPGIEHPADAFVRTVSSNYFTTLHIPLKLGRFFDDRDAENSEPTAIINDSLAHAYLPGENPVGKYVRVFDETKKDAPWLRVVGVVGNERRTNVYSEMSWADSPLMYRPFDQDPLASASIVARLSGAADLGRVSDGIQRTVQAVDPNATVDPLIPISDLASRATAYPRFRAVLLTAFAALALMLATIGLFGVLSHSVAQRRQEIGVRMALGAQKASVVTMILKEGFWLTGAGMVLGIAASWMLTRYLSALLYGVRPNPVFFGAAVLVLLPAAFLAMYLPGWRAAHVDPMTALRYE